MILFFIQFVSISISNISWVYIGLFQSKNDAAWYCSWCYDDVQSSQRSVRSKERWESMVYSFYILADTANIIDRCTAGSLFEDIVNHVAGLIIGILITVLIPAL